MLAEIADCDGCLAEFVQQNLCELCGVFTEFAAMVLVVAGPVTAGRTARESCRVKGAQLVYFEAAAKRRKLR